MPPIPDRWFMLVGANFFGWLVLLVFVNVAPRTAAAWNIVFSIGIALGLPLSLLAWALRHWGVAFALVLLCVNPFLWAAMVELALRRFVEPPKDSDRE